jgi:hypothetical protein
MAMIRTLPVALAALLALAAGTAPGDDKKADKAKSTKPTGTWVRDLGGENKVTFEIKGDSLKVLVATGGEKIEAEAAYGVTSTGTLFGIITKKASDAGPPEGEMFNFKFKLADNVMTVSDLHPDNAEAKQLVEGEYKKQK